MRQKILTINEFKAMMRGKRDYLKMVPIYTRLYKRTHQLKQVRDMRMILEINKNITNGESIDKLISEV